MNHILKNKEETNPSYWLKLGERNIDHGQHEKAIQCFKNAAQLKPDDADIYFNMGLLQQKLSLFKEAVAAFEKVIQLDPHHIEAHYNMGVALHLQGRLNEAIFRYKKSIELKPDFVESIYNMGSAFYDLKKYHEAISCYQGALKIDPAYYQALYNMGNIYKELGDYPSALRCYQEVLAEKPDLAEAYNNMGVIHKNLKDNDKAKTCYQAALDINPQFVEAHYNMGIILQTKGKYEEGLESFKKAHELDPEYLPARWLYLLSLPMFYEDEKEIAFYRKRFTENLGRLIQEIKLETPKQIKLVLQGISSTTNFFLQYQGMNDLALQKKYGELICRVMGKNLPQWTAPHPMPVLGDVDKVRLGFVSSFMYGHTVGLFLLGWLRGLNRNQFEIYCYHIGHTTDSLTRNIQNHCDRFIQIGPDTESAADKIISDKIHILTYTDIGMNPQATLLASLRLAPLQCKGWGHPVTTGLPTIDYYLSSDLMEPENGSADYSEKLIRLPNLALAYSKPAMPISPKTRNDFRLDPDAFIYLTSQSLFKYLPQYDFIYPEIAKRVRNARFVFIYHPSFYVTNQFQNRLSAAFKKHNLKMEEFCCFLPRLDFDDFLSLNLVSDVLLDTLSWSGGKTSLEAISCGLPIVTLPGRFMRGRHAYGILKMMGVTETIAKDENDYIEIASKLGNHPGFYLNVACKIKENSQKIYDDQTFIDSLNDFYQIARPEKQVKKITKENCTFWVTGNEPLFHNIPFWDAVNQNLWENRTFQIIKRYCDPDQAYIDIGSWIGPTALVGANYSKHTYAVEPDPVAFNQLKMNVNLNPDLQNKITLCHFCIGDTSGKKRLVNKDAFGDSRSSILSTGSDFGMDVKSLTFNDFVDLYHIKNCCFIKMDIEGAEFLIIPTMEDFLIEYKPTLFISLHNLFIGPDLDKKRSELVSIFLKHYHYIYDSNGRRLHNASELNQPLCDIIVTDKKWEPID